MLTLIRSLAVAGALLVAGCSGEEDELQKRLEDHERRIADLESRLSQAAALPGKKSSPAKPSSGALLPAPKTESDPLLPATQTSPAIGFSPKQATEDQRLAIRALCSRRFGSNWQLVEQCEADEMAALARISEGNSQKLPPEIYGAIRVQCAQEGGGEFSREAACQDEKTDAYLRAQ